MNDDLIKKTGVRVGSFIAQVIPLNQSQRMVVACSGGQDSMCLLEVMAWLYKTDQLRGELSVCHIQHGGAEDQIQRADLVKKRTHELGLKFTLHKILDLSLDQANYEARARAKRLMIWNRKEFEGKGIVTGHHIDDSFEWHLAQSLKSSSLKSSMGIPLKNSPFLRPFLCLTKSFIKFLSNECEITFIEDQSNDNERFERVRLRKMIAQSIAPSYPSYLKHYCDQMNELALGLGFHAQSFLKHKLDFFSEGPLYGVAGSKKPFPEVLLKKWVRETVKKLSDEGRGELREQIEKVIGCFDVSSGPHSLGSEVLAFTRPGQIFLIRRDQMDYFQKEDERLKKIISEIPEPSLLFQEKIKKGQENSLKDLPWAKKAPFWVIASQKEGKRLMSSLKAVDPLFPSFTQELLNRNLWFRTYYQIKKVLEKRGEGEIEQKVDQQICP